MTDERQLKPAVASKVWWWLGSAAALAAGLLLVLRLYQGWRQEVSPELQALVAAAGSIRATEGRLTGGFGYAPRSSPTRAARSTRELSPDLRIAIARVEKKASSSATTRSLQALGIALVLQGRFDEAIVRLEEAAAARPKGAAVLSDLSAAYYARARAAASSGKAGSSLAPSRFCCKTASGFAWRQPPFVLPPRERSRRGLSLSTMTTNGTIAHSFRS